MQVFFNCYGISKETLRFYLNHLKKCGPSYYIRKKTGLSKLSRPGGSYEKINQELVLKIEREESQSVLFAWLFSCWCYRKFGRWQGANYDLQALFPGLYSRETWRRAFRRCEELGLIKISRAIWRSAYNHRFPLKTIIFALTFIAFKKIPGVKTHNIPIPENLPTLEIDVGVNGERGPPFGENLYLLSKHYESLEFDKRTRGNPFAFKSGLDYSLPTFKKAIPTFEETVTECWWNSILNEDYCNETDLGGAMDLSFLDEMNSTLNEFEQERVYPKFATTQDELAYIFKKNGRGDLAEKAGSFIDFCKAKNITNPAAALVSSFKNGDYLFSNWSEFQHQERTKDCMRNKPTARGEYAHKNFKKQGMQRLGELATEILSDTIPKKSDIDADIPKQNLVYGPFEPIEVIIKRLEKKLGGSEKKPVRQSTFRLD